jgi:hypothetical protein
VNNVDVTPALLEEDMVSPDAMVKAARRIIDMLQQRSMEMQTPD